MLTSLPAPPPPPATTWCVLFGSLFTQVKSQTESQDMKATILESSIVSWSWYPFHLKENRRITVLGESKSMFKAYCGWTKSVRKPWLKPLFLGIHSVFSTPRFLNGGAISGFRLYRANRNTTILGGLQSMFETYSLLSLFERCGVLARVWNK